MGRQPANKTETSTTTAAPVTAVDPNAVNLLDDPTVEDIGGAHDIEDSLPPVMVRENDGEEVAASEEVTITPNSAVDEEVRIKRTALKNPTTGAVSMSIDSADSK
jgi:hypothetical protein